MKIYGYSDAGLAVEEVVPEALAEITLCATPVELRQVSAFLESCASEMERMGSTYSHVHLADRIKAFESSPHFVVAGLESDET